MTFIPEMICPETWMRVLFSTREACRGGVMKRQIKDVERIVGRDVFLREIERRGWQALENGGHFIICCNAQPIRRVRASGVRARAPDAGARPRLRSLLLPSCDPITP